MHDRTNNERWHVAAAIRFHWHRAQGRWLVFFRGWPARCARVTGQRGLWARGSCCVERTTRFASCWQGAGGVGEGVSRWRVFFGRWPARCARVAGQRGLRARGPCCVERTTRFASCWQGAGGVGEGMSRWLGLFLGGGGQRAVRGSLVSAGLGPRVLLCGAHDSLRLVLAGGGWRGGAGSRDLQRATPFSLSRPARALRAGGLRPSSSLDRCASA